MTTHPASPNGRYRYDTEEHYTGEDWINGQPILRRVIDFGALPNNATKDVAHEITGLDQVVSLSGVAFTSIGTTIHLPLPYLNAAATTNVELIIISNDIRVVTNSDFSNWASTFIIIKYTKT